MKKLFKKGKKHTLKNGKVEKNYEIKLEINPFLIINY